MLMTSLLALFTAGCGLLGASRGNSEPVSGKQQPTVTIDTPVVAVTDTTKKSVIDSLQLYPPKKGKSWEKKARYSMSLVLPFSTDESELEKLMLEENITGYQPLASLEFYEGALMALDTLDSLGIALDVHVFNHFKDSSLTAALFSKPELRRSDVIIGPVFNEGLKAAAAVALKQEVFLISPLSPNHQFTDSNRYFMMANPEASVHMRAMLQQVRAAHPSANIICVYRSDKPAEAKLAGEFKHAFNIAAAGSAMQLKEVYNYTGIIEALTDNDNYVFIASFDELFSNGLIRDLSKASREKPITLLGLQHTLSYESVSIDYYENLHFTYPTSYYIDRLSPKVKNFQEGFSRRFETRPSDFACRGYDLVLYAGMMLHTYGPDLAASAGKTNPAEAFMLYPLRFSAEKDANGHVQFYENSAITTLRFDQFRFEVMGR